MTRACHLAVRAATGEVFSDSEIDAFLDTLAQRAKRAGEEGPTLTEREAIAHAARAVTRDELMTAMVDRRMRVAAALAKKVREARIEAMPASLDEAQKLRAYNVGAEKQGKGTAASVDAEGRARTMSAWGEVELGLRQVPGLIDRISNFWGVGEKEVDRKIARELARLNGNGSVEPTGDEGAFHAAQVFGQALDKVRTAQNDAGAFIAKLEGYIARQSHDRLKVAGGFWREMAELGRRLKADDVGALDWKGVRLAAAKRAFREWRDFIRPKLDPKTFEGLTEGDFDEHQADAQGLHERGVIDDPGSLEERMLYRVWADIVTGRHETLRGMDDLGEFRPAASKARAVSKARVLHFAGPDQWVDYNARYGTGSLFKTVLLQLERGAKNAALMQRWGPAPDAAFDAEAERLAKAARARGDTAAAGAVMGGKTRATFEAINGALNTPENLRFAMVARNIRSWEAITKLGGIVLSKVTDIPLTGQTFARAGAGFLSGYEGSLRGILHLQSAEGRHAAELLDVGARAFANHLTGDFASGQGLTGWLSWASRLMYRINLFDYANEGSRRGAAEMLARHLGEEAKAPWAGLREGTRETFERYGISDSDWEAVRHGLEPAADGRTYFTLDHLERVVADPAQRAELSLRFRTLVHGIVDDTTSEPRAREQLAVSGASKPGTALGEAARAFGQFRGFVHAVLGRHLVPAAQGYAGYAPVALMSHMMVACTLAGWVSMNAKLIARGQQPKSFVGADAKETLKLWGAAMAQGGGLGIYGDFLFGEQNRNGLDFTLSALAGPAVGDAEQVLQTIRAATHGDLVTEDGRSLLPGELVRLGARNIPLVNLWYTRLALDYAVLWRLQEAVSPGYLARYESRVQNQEGGSFIVPPSAAQ